MDEFKLILLLVFLLLLLPLLVTRFYFHRIRCMLFTLIFVRQRACFVVGFFSRTLWMYDDGKHIYDFI